MIADKSVGVIKARRLKPGDRCRLSTIGVERCPKMKIHTGTVVSMSRTSNGYCVLLDGNKRPITLHRTYIEALDKARTESTPPISEYEKPASHHFHPQRKR